MGFFDEELTNTQALFAWLLLVPIIAITSYLWIEALWFWSAASFCMAILSNWW